MKKSAIVLFSMLFAVSAFAQSIQEGINNLYAERYASAKAVFDKLLASNPNNLDAVYWEGQTLIEQNDVAGARALYEKILSANGNAPIILVGLGHVDLLDNKAADAHQRFESAISLSHGKKGDDPDVLNAIGRANVDAKAGDMDYAIQKLTAASAAAPNNPDVFLNLGNAYRKKLEGGQAIMAYTKATQLNPKFAIAYYRMARLYETQRNWDIFQQDLNQAIQADPKFAPAYYSLYYYTLAYQKDFAKAEQYANQYVSSSDPSVNNDYIKAQTSYMQKNYDAAIATAKNIVAQAGDKANPRVYRLLSYASLEKGDTAGARTYVDQFFAKAKEGELIGNDYTLKADIYGKDDPSVVAPLYIQAAKQDSVLANQLKFLQEGIDRFKASGQKVYEAELRTAAYELKPERNQAELFAIGLPYYQGGAYQKADSFFTAYAQAFPDSIYGYYWSALARSQVDSTMSQGLAVPQYEKALQIAQTDKVKFKSQGFQSAGYMAGYYNNIKGDKQTAISYLQKALEFDPTNEAIQKNIQILQRPAPKARSAAPAKKTSGSKTTKKG